MRKLSWKNSEIYQSNTTKINLIGKITVNHLKISVPNGLPKQIKNFFQLMIQIFEFWVF